MAGGRSSGVERQLPKLNVVGSNPIARSIGLPSVCPVFAHWSAQCPSNDPIHLGMPAPCRWPITKL
jgi:hypothetical protein